MKKILLFFALLLTSVSIYAQNDVTTFLGIPIDGFKPEMIKQLKAKGFVSDEYYPDILKGEFNGQDVNVYVSTNNNKVYRIMVADTNLLSEADIKNRFNILCSQFEKNERYVSLGDQTISAEEDISYEMLVHNKVYEAHFYQKMSDETQEKLSSEVSAAIEALKEKYTQEQLDSMTQEERVDLVWPIVSESMFEILSMKTVWFRICEFEGEYYIAMYYDNGYNKSNGEDL